MELPQPLAKLDLPRIDQVGYVVRDLSVAVARYEPLFGPFTRLDTPLTGVWYRGVPTDVHLSIAFGHTGDIEIEFIQPVSGASPHTEFLAAGRDGIHHVRYRVPDANATIAALGTVGFAPIWRHDLGHESSRTWNIRAATAFSSRCCSSGSETDASRSPHDGPAAFAAKPT